MLNKTTKPKKTNNNYKKESYLTLTQVFRRLLFVELIVVFLVASVVATSSPSSSLSVTKNASGSAETPDSMAATSFLVAPFLW